MRRYGCRTPTYLKRKAMSTSLLLGLSAGYLCVLAVLSVPLIPEPEGITGANFSTRQDQEEYLTRFNYLRRMSVNVPASIGEGDDAFTSATRDFQHMAGLPEAGVVDEATQRMMAKPRCGVADHLMPPVEGKRKRRFTPWSRWSKTDLTYRIINFSSDMPESDQVEEIRRAFKVWSDHSPLTFTRVLTGSADIEILFGTYSHGDHSPFDGPAHVLAHAFYPPVGDTHMDDSEQFTKDTFSGINMFQVLAHEFGHALGLSHSSVRKALMAPFYRGYDPEFVLHSDDIAGIQFLYGPNTATTKSTSIAPLLTSTKASTTKSTTTTSSTATLSKSTSTARTTLSTNSSTKNPTTTRTTAPVPTTTTTNGTTSTSPPTTTPPTAPLPSTTRPTTRSTNNRTTSTRATGRSSTAIITTSASTTTAPSDSDFCDDGHLDAVTIYKGKTYFFRGDQYALLNDEAMEPGYPKKISDDWPGLPNDIDAALYIPETNTNINRNGQWIRKQITARNYFFKGSLCWRYKLNGLVPSYPKPISQEFLGLPDNIESAFVWGANNKIYLTKGTLYYRISSLRWTLTVDSGYPKPLSAWNGLPETIDSALQWKNGLTYFFKDKYYYRYNDQADMVDISYPRSYHEWWLGCPNSLFETLRKGEQLEIH